MNSLSSIAQLFLMVCVIAAGSSSRICSQESGIVELTIHPRSVPANPNEVTLLPQEHQLRDGNAAVELLRMPWEQMNFMRLMGKRMDEWLEMKGDHSELLEYESSFALFKEKMRRAAYTRSADWDYPIGEQPLITILLPDVQGMRAFAGHVMSLWIKVQIEKGELKNAKDGILIQIACARHVSRTPFIVCQLVGTAIVRIGFRQLEDLIQQPEAENFYHALAKLPDTLGDFRSAVDLEVTMLSDAMPSIDTNVLPSVGDPVWETAYVELFENFLSAYGVVNEIDRQQTRASASKLVGAIGFSKDQIARMSDEEIVVRWLWRNHQMISSKYIAALQLPMHDTVQSLALLEKEVETMLQIPDAGSPPKGASPAKLFGMYTPQAFLGCHRLGSEAKLLQIVEAIRHHASLNNNKLPESLEEIDLPIPLDPFTDKPAIYERNNGVATLRWPAIPNVDAKQNNVRQSYKIKIAEPN